MRSTSTWSPDGALIAYAGNNAVQVTDVASGKTSEVAPASAEHPVLPLAVVFSPDGKTIAYQRRAPTGDAVYNQIFVTDLSE